MKNLISALLLVLISAMVSVGATVALTSTGVLQAPLSDKDSLKIVGIAQSVAFPKYTDSDQFIVDSTDDANMLSAVSLINTMEPKTVAIIADKAISSFGYVDYTTFVTTYETSKDVYDSADGTLKKTPVDEYQGQQQSSTDQSAPPIDNTQRRVVEKDSSKTHPTKGLTIHINGD